MCCKSLSTEAVVKLNPTLLIIMSNHWLNTASLPLNCVTQICIYTPFKWFQRWWPNCFPGQIVAALLTLLLKKFLPISNLNHPSPNLTPFCIAFYLGREANPYITTAFFHAVVESHKVHPKPSVLQTEHSQLPQPHLIRFVPETLQISFVALLQRLDVFLVMRGPNFIASAEPSTHTEHDFQAWNSLLFSNSVVELQGSQPELQAQIRHQKNPSKAAFESLIYSIIWRWVDTTLAALGLRNESSFHMTSPCSQQQYSWKGLLCCVLTLCNCVTFSLARQSCCSINTWSPLPVPGWQQLMDHIKLWFVS